MPVMAQSDKQHVRFDNENPKSFTMACKKVCMEYLEEHCPGLRPDECDADTDYSDFEFPETFNWLLVQDHVRQVLNEAHAKQVTKIKLLNYVRTYLKNTYRTDAEIAEAERAKKTAKTAKVKANANAGGVDGLSSSSSSSSKPAGGVAAGKGRKKNDKKAAREKAARDAEACNEAVVKECEEVYEDLAGWGKKLADDINSALTDQTDIPELEEVFRNVQHCEKKVSQLRQPSKDVNQIWSQVNQAAATLANGRLQAYDFAQAFSTPRIEADVTGKARTTKGIGAEGGKQKRMRGGVVGQTHRKLDEDRPVKGGSKIVFNAMKNTTATIARKVFNVVRDITRMAKVGVDASARQIKAIGRARLINENNKSSGKTEGSSSSSSSSNGKGLGRDAALMVIDEEEEEQDEEVVWAPAGEEGDDCDDGDDGGDGNGDGEDDGDERCRQSRALDMGFIYDSDDLDDDEVVVADRKYTHQQLKVELKKREARVKYLEKQLKMEYQRRRQIDTVINDFSEWKEVPAACAVVHIVQPLPDEPDTIIFVGDDEHPRLRDIARRTHAFLRKVLIDERRHDDLVKVRLSEKGSADIAKDITKKGTKTIFRKLAAQGVSQNLGTLFKKRAGGYEDEGEEEGDEERDEEGEVEMEWEGEEYKEEARGAQMYV